MTTPPSRPDPEHDEAVIDRLVAEFVREVRALERQERARQIAEAAAGEG